MEELHINLLAIVIATVANFIFGFIWYTPLFGKAWGKEMGYDMNEKPQTGAMVKGMLSMVIGNFLMAWVFAHNNGAWSYVPSMHEMSPTVSAINAAVFTWLGFYFPVDLGSIFWERKSTKLFFINTGYHLGMLLIASFILAFM